jgi:hypothetical protein
MKPADFQQLRRALASVGERGGDVRKVALPPGHRTIRAGTGGGHAGLILSKTNKINLLRRG